MFKKILKIIIQALIIYGFLKVGEGVSYLIKPILFIPGSLLGMLFMFVGLLTGLLKIAYIKELSEFLLKHMGFFFIPLGVGLLASAKMLQSAWWQLSILLIVSCCLVMAVSAKVTEILIRMTNKKQVAK